MTKREIAILNTAFGLGFTVKEYYSLAKETTFDYAHDHIVEIEDSFEYLFEHMINFAEWYITKHQAPEFVKEVYVDLQMVCVFEYYTQQGCCVTVTDPQGLIDWDLYKDKVDDEKAYFREFAVDSDGITVLKFFDYCSKYKMLQ